MSFNTALARLRGSLARRLQCNTRCTALPSGSSDPNIAASILILLFLYLEDLFCLLANPTVTPQDCSSPNPLFHWASFSPNLLQPLGNTSNLFSKPLFHYNSRIFWLPSSSVLFHPLLTKSKDTEQDFKPYPSETDLQPSLYSTLFTH